MDEKPFYISTRVWIAQHPKPGQNIQQGKHEAITLHYHELIGRQMAIMRSCVVKTLTINNF